jgi:hypothetical protein
MRASSAARASDGWRGRGVRRRARLLAVCGAAVLLETTGCMAWRQVPDVSEPSAAEASHPRALVVLRDGTRRLLHDVTVRADSVVGHAGADRARVAVARTEVESVQTRELSVGRTLGLVGGVLAVLALVALVAVVKAFSEGFTAAPSPTPALP